MNWTTIIVAAVSAFGSAVVGRAAKRTPRQERRDDFTTVTDRLDKHINRLEDRVTAQDATIRGQSTAIGHMAGWIRALTVFIRVQGLEPPPPPPIPDDARPFLHDIGV